MSSAASLSYAELDALRSRAVADADAACRERLDAIRAETAKAERERDTAKALAEKTLADEVATRKAALAVEVAAELDSHAQRWAGQEGIVPAISPRRLAREFRDAFRALEARAREHAGAELSPMHVAYALAVAIAPGNPRLHFPSLWDGGAFWSPGLLNELASAFVQADDICVAEAALRDLEREIVTRLGRAAPDCEPGEVERRRAAISLQDFREAEQERAKRLEAERIREAELAARARQQALEELAAEGVDLSERTNIGSMWIPLHDRIRAKTAEIVARWKGAA